MNFDEYRRRYGELTDGEHRAAYSTWYQLWPVQRHVTLPSLDRFLSEHSRALVIEMGGWDGYGAELMLERYPQLKAWLNVEICAEAADLGQQRIKDARYCAAVPGSFRWWRGEIAASPDSVLVASHVLEHLSDIDAMDLIQTQRPKAWYIEAPLSEGGQSWDSYGGSHVLHAGWGAVESWLSEAGYHRQWIEGDARSFGRL
jgi:hypothetical protein